LSELRALLVTPLSGPLARFGQPGATALRLWAEEAAKVPPRWRRVRLHVQDAHPDSAAAMRRGLASQPHLVFGPYGSGPALRALGATERTVWNHGGASSQIRWPAVPRAVNVLAPSSSYFQGTLEAVRRADPEARRVVILNSTTGFGADVGRGAAAAATRLHFEATAIGFATGGAGRAASRLRGGDVLLVAGGFDDELAAVVVSLRREWRAVGCVAAGVDEVLASLGDAREGLLGPAQWIATAAPEPDEGPDVRWFTTRYRSAAGVDPPYPAVQAFAAGVLAARCLRDAGAGDDAAQFAAARSLRCRTLYGEFRLDPVTGLQVGHEVLTVQWQGGRRRVVWPPSHAERALAYPRSQG
jgi:branched-chain amino acid transport system substrate-binding protein